MELETNVYRLDRMTHAKLAGLDKKKTLVMAVQSPMEVHGPHLPIGQDLFEAEALAEKSLNLLAAERPDWSFVLLPPAAVSIDCVPGAGSIAYPISLVRDVAYHSLRPFAKQGFARLAFSSFHGSPRHICALEEAAEGLHKRYNAPAVSVFSVAVSRIMKGDIFHDAVKDTPGFELNAEQVDMDSHAGFVETSLALHLWPELVEDGWQSLPPSTKFKEDEKKTISYLFSGGERNPVEHIQAMFERIKSIEATIKHFNNSTYAGYPAHSSADLGERLFKTLAEMSRSILSDFIDSGMDMERHSPLWKLRGLLQNRAVNVLADDVFKVFGD